ncbi:hypothetical protein BASA81_015849 [Batrachochytrium salamandrivorans]|nr:hypothetical protein BASA81_015849 [Batrachochytrium salamandrivorans]
MTTPSRAAPPPSSISPRLGAGSFPEGGFPYCQKSRQLLLELKRSPDWLPAYNEEGVRLVIEECSVLDESISRLEQTLASEQDEQAKRNLHLSQLFHLCLCRNKRAMVAYFSLRNEKIEQVYWETGAVAMPLEFASKLSRRELEYYSGFQLLVTRTMDKLDLDLLSSRMPPGTNLLVNVRCVQELGQVLLQSGASVFLAKNSTHYLRRDDVEHFIRQDLMEEVA